MTSAKAEDGSIAPRDALRGSEWRRIAKESKLHNDSSRLLSPTRYKIITPCRVPCTYRISVKAIVKDSTGRVLLGREKDGSWELPGGGMEHGEKPKEALAREVAEETGFKVDWISDQPVAFWTINKEVGSPTLKWFAFVAYEVRISGEFKPSSGTNDEVEEIRYVSQEEARVLKLHDNTRPYFSQI